MRKMLAGVRNIPFLLAFFLLCHFAVFFLPFSMLENAGMFLFVSVLHWCLYTPYALHRFSEQHETKPVQVDTVALNDGIPYYCMGNFVCYLEKRR